MTPKLLAYNPEQVVGNGTFISEEAMARNSGKGAGQGWDWKGRDRQ